MIETVPCPHPDFDVAAVCIRLEDVGAFAAEFKVECLMCHEPFAFVGEIPIGFSPRGPSLSADRTELRVPIVPLSGGPTPTMGFSITQQPERKFDA